MTRPRLALLAVLLALGLGGGLWLGHRAEAGRLASACQHLERRLTRLGLRSDFESLLSRRWQQVWPHLRGRLVTAAGLATTVEGFRRAHGGEGCEVWLFASGGELLRSWPPAPAAIPGSGTAWAAPAVFAHLRRPWPDPHPGPHEDRTGLESLLGTVRVADRLRGRPGQVRALRVLGRYSWGGWAEDRSVSDPRAVAGAVVFWHRERIAPTDRLHWLLQAPGASAADLGFASRWRAGLGRPPPGVASTTLAAAVATWQTGAASRLTLPQGVLVLQPTDDEFLLVGLVPRRTPVIPGLALALTLTALALGLRLSLDPPRRLRLTWLVAALLAGAAGLPLAVTLGFWAHFADSRRQAVVADELAGMTRQLVEIDKLMPGELRRTQHRLRDLTAGALASDLASVQARLDDLERERIFNLALIVDEAGQHCRGFSNYNIELDALLPLPLALRRQMLLDFVAQGHPMSQEVFSFTWNWQDPGDGTIPRRLFVGDTPELDRNIADTAAAIGRDLLRRCNAGRDGGAGGDSASALVLGSVIESTGGGLVREIQSELGNFVALGTSERVALVFSSILYAADGRARFYVLTFQDMCLFTRRLLYRLFTGQLGSPSGLQLAAFAEHYNHQFPSRKAWHRFRPVSRLIPPGQRGLGCVVTPRHGHPFLLAAHQCRHIHNYTLIGVRPWRQLEARHQALATDLALAGLAMALVLATLGWRLARGLLTPTRAMVEGMAAMGRSDFDHRIRLDTGDEWEGLAEAFNRALAGMREQELARAVQVRLLPAHPLQVGGVSFHGQSVMTSSVGGDFYDAHLLPDGRMAFFLGDVSGHGVSAALVVAMIKSGFEEVLRAGATTPATVLDQLSQLLIRHVKRVKMMTAIAGMVDGEGRLSLGNAGHPWPILIGPDGRVEMIRQSSFPLGTITRRRYTDTALRLPPGGRLVLYSDGVSEGQAPDEAPFGFDRLTAALQAIGPQPPAAIIAGLQRALRDFTRSEPWHDDVSIAVLAHA